MYIAYKSGERPNVRPSSLLPVRSRMIQQDNCVCVEEIYNANFIGSGGVVIDCPEGEWYDDIRLDPMNVVFYSSNGDGTNRILCAPFPGNLIQCEECGTELMWEPRLNEELRYCPKCDEKTTIIQSFGKDIFNMDQYDDVPWDDSEIPF